jgi:3-deoxy-D-manno-octulosonic-acid transferase
MLFYYFGIRLYAFVIHLSALFNPKAKRFIEGRKNWKTNYIDFFSHHKIDKPVLWVHCASVGEFEQGRVLIESLKEKREQYFVLLTFFSPSGFELRKNYAHADAVLYLPLDIKGNAERFINIVNPSIAVFVKYEIWLGYFKVLAQKNIPTYLICAKFRANQIYFKWFGKPFKSALHKITHLFVQAEEDQTILRQHHIHNHTLAGDLRYERVLEIKQQIYHDEVIEHFIQENQKIIVAGSTWQPDETILLNALLQLKAKGKAIKLIIAPHEIDQQHLEKLTHSLNQKKLIYQLYSTYKQEIMADVLIIDRIGLLSKLYRYATIAYVGGGFGKGIHNTLEPAVYGCPVIFGPKHQKFFEAKLLIEKGCGFSIDTNEALTSKIEELMDSRTALQEISERIAVIFQGQKNASNIIKKTVFKN